MADAIEEKNLVKEENQLSGGSPLGEAAEAKKRKKKNRRQRKRNAAVFNSMGEPSGGSGSIAESQNIDVQEKLDAFINNNKAACKMLMEAINQVQDSSKEENSKNESITSDDSGIKVLYKCDRLNNGVNLGDSSMSVNKCGFENETELNQTFIINQKAVHSHEMLFDEVDFNKVPNPSIQSVDVNGNKLKINMKEMIEIPWLNALELQQKLKNIQNQAATATSKGRQRDPTSDRKDDILGNKVMTADTDVDEKAFLKLNPKNAASFCGTGTDHYHNQEQKTKINITSASAHNTLGKLDEDKLPSFVHMDQNKNYQVEHYESGNEGENNESVNLQQHKRRCGSRNAAEFLKFLGDHQLDKTSILENPRTGANYSKFNSTINQKNQDRGLQLENGNEYQIEVNANTTKEGFVDIDLEPNYFSTTEIGPRNLQRYVSVVFEDPKANGEEGDFIPNSNSQSKIKPKSSKENKHRDSGKEKKNTSGFKSLFPCFSSKKDKDFRSDKKSEKK